MRITFLDREGSEINSYNPNNIEKKGPIHELASENEQLIGVYGIKDQFKHLTGFGFIVAVKQP